ncbi:MAG: hypothetical protein K8R92_00835 [Planctomycetes bacterium]|nr:hypothetical protein [Planctomycetota bacterium]
MSEDPPTTLEQAILDTAASPASASNDAGSVTGQSIPDLIAADKHLAAKKAAGNPRKSLRFSKIIPPGPE